jgi:hypothetical protein
VGTKKSFEQEEAKVAEKGAARGLELFFVSWCLGGSILLCADRWRLIDAKSVVQKMGRWGVLACKGEMGN